MRQYPPVVKWQFDDEAEHQDPYLDPVVVSYMGILAVHMGGTSTAVGRDCVGVCRTLDESSDVSRDCEMDACLFVAAFRMLVPYPRAVVTTLLDV